MPSLLQRVRGASESRGIATVDDYVALVNEATYGLSQSWAGDLKPDGVIGQFRSLAQAHGTNAVVFSVMAVRQLVFSAIRFRWQVIRDGKPADMFGSPDLDLLETPWVGGTTQDLLSRMIQYADLAGNAYTILDTPLTRLGGDDQPELVALRPDYMQIVCAPRWRYFNYPAKDRGQLGWKKVGYLYTEGGEHSGNDPVPLLLDEVAHFMPMPDPLAAFRGMSWLTPVIREIQNDSLMNKHKRKFFENGATPNMIIKHAGNADRDKILDFAKRLEAENGGVDNAYRTLNLYPGADATVVGANMQQLDFRQVQGAGETRIAAAGGTPPVIVGLSEGLQAATYSNYAQARRRYADGTLHPLWQNAAGTLGVLFEKARRTLRSPGGVRLWYDSDDIPFLREDETDAANIAFVRAQTIRQLLDAGYTPDSVIAAVDANDFRLLAHTGLFSVQLRPPGSTDPTNPTPPAGPAPDGGANA